MACPVWTDPLDLEVHQAPLEELGRKETVVFKVINIFYMVDRLNSKQTCTQAFLEFLEETGLLELRVARESEVLSVLREIKVCLDQSAFKEKRVTKDSQVLMV